MNGGEGVDYLFTFCFSFSILSWNDSISSLKATLLTGPIVRYMATEQLLNPSLASNLMIAVLQAFQVHGQHDSNQVRWRRRRKKFDDISNNILF